MVTSRALAAAGAAVVPIPGADIVVDLGLLSSLLPPSSRAFALDHDSVAKFELVVAERVLLVAARLGNNIIGRLVTRKLVGALLRRDVQ